MQCAGLPDGVVNILQGDAGTGAALCRSPLVGKVSFTGGLKAGQEVAATCALNSIKPVTLELGGKSSVIMFVDADVDMCVSGALAANYFSQGNFPTLLQFTLFYT